MIKLHTEGFEVVYMSNGNLKEERTVSLNGVVLSDTEIEREEQQNIVMYDLFLGAQALSLAQTMERERKDYFESLYDFSYGVINLSDEPVYHGSTESKALDIIDQKAAYDLKTMKDIKEAIVNLTVEIGEEIDENYLRVEIAGQFNFKSEGDVDESVIYKYYEVNGTAILFPYLRSVVSDLTSKGHDSPIILPTINIPALLKSREEAKEIPEEGSAKE